jgi:hypothetical protein
MGHNCPHAVGFPIRQDAQEQLWGVDIAALEFIVAGAPDASPAGRAAVSKDDSMILVDHTRISSALPYKLLNMESSLSISPEA